MAASIFGVLLLLLIVALPAIIGVALLVTTRRSPGHPACGACGYDVSETMGRSKTCPECGADLGAAGVVPGVPRRGGARQVIGWVLVCMTLATVLLYAGAFVAGRMRREAAMQARAAAAAAQSQQQLQIRAEAAARARAQVRSQEALREAQARGRSRTDGPPDEPPDGPPDGPADGPADGR